MMRETSRVLTSLGVIVLVSGCRAATRVTEMPRVDLGLSSGNRGYLVGTPPPVSAERKTTREMVEADIELPALLPATVRSKKPVSLREVAPPEVDMSEEALLPEAASAPQAYDSYVVKPGDTLWSIAADPQVFGNATQWRRIFEANRDRLKSPDRLRAGMTLRIPRGEWAEPDPSQDTTTSTK